MNATKIIWSQVLLVCLVVVAFVRMATEWTAWRLGFQSRRDLRQPMGDNLFRRLYQAWVDGDGLLVIRDQVLTPEQ